jgi:glycosyltransferase involved in cell wall biosynthesis
MKPSSRPIRVVYSFPHKLGADRICHTAWQQVNGLAAAGAEVTVFPGVLHRPVAQGVNASPTLARGNLRIPYKLLGSMRAFALHDYIVARRIEKLAGEIDVIHTWPLGALETLKTARRLGIPTVLERPNAHTRFAMEAVRAECARVNVALPSDHEHAFNAEKLLKEDREYRLADYLLCPSEFVLSTFLSAGFQRENLLRHQYGYDGAVYYPCDAIERAGRPFTLLFAGGCAPRKGLHYALRAWLQSPAHNDGVFLIAGSFLPDYAARLSSLLSHPSIRVMGHRQDLPELMRKSDVLVLPSLEEGSALVTYEARGSGCVLLVSEAAGAMCKHMENALVHKPGDLDALTAHMAMLYNDRVLLERLRRESLRTTSALTWLAAGIKLVRAYEGVLAAADRKKAVVA